MTKSFELSAKRGIYFDVADYLGNTNYALPAEENKQLNRLDIIYRALCSMLYNYVPLSGHVGGSVSSGHFASYLIYKTLAYELARPHREDADIISYAAGHKALGMYALWALRNECVRIARPELLAEKVEDQLRLEDLLGFRRNRVTDTPLFKKFNVKPLGGHPEPLVPFVRTSTGASGVGDASAVGMAFGAMDAYGQHAPKVHIIEGEGGLTAGRAGEALAAAATAQLKNVVFHLDWNEASIETNRVTNDGKEPGDYVQWTPAELFYIHDFNVINVPNGMDFEQVHIANQLAKEINNHQPTAIIYRTVKGWRYGLEGIASHGSGFKFCSEGFEHSLQEMEEVFQIKFEHFQGEQTPEVIEKYYWNSLLKVRDVLENNKDLAAYAAEQVAQRAKALDALKREPRADLGRIEEVYTYFKPEEVPAEFEFKPGEKYTTRGVLGGVLNYLNKQTNGGFLVGSADLYGSSNSSAIGKGFGQGLFYNSVTNPQGRLISVGGICEDGMSGICSGVSSFGKHIGVSSSYGAFLAFQHVSARLHAIGYQLGRAHGQKPNTLILFNSHTGLPTGEDGPTHADPQSLQLVQDNFPKGLCITATPLEVDEIWPLVTQALRLRPAVFCPFAVRPSEKMMDRNALGADPAVNAVKGVYYLHRAPEGKEAGTLLVQGAGIGKIFVNGVLPEIKKQGLELNVIYITSRELFEQLPEAEQEQLVPLRLRRTAMGLTDFTLPTLDAWINSNKGRRHTLFPHKHGEYLGSANGAKLYEEAGLSPRDIIKAVQEYVADLKDITHWQ